MINSGRNYFFKFSPPRIWNFTSDAKHTFANKYGVRCPYQTNDWLMRKIRLLDAYLCRDICKGQTLDLWLRLKQIQHGARQKVSHTLASIEADFKNRINDHLKLQLCWKSSLRLCHIVISHFSRDASTSCK